MLYFLSSAELSFDIFQIGKQIVDLSKKFQTLLSGNFAQLYIAIS